MKKETQNTFSDGLTYDMHPIVTPNTVLTDNLNGSFITYNGNEFCLQNDKGNVIKAELKSGYVPIGIKEHNGILYIVSCDDNGNNEIGIYPGFISNEIHPIDWRDQLIIEHPYDLHYDNYTALINIKNSNNERIDFNAKLGMDKEHPVTIEVQDSYDGSVNLILTDDKNPPRLVNTGFSVLPNNQFKLLDKTYNWSSLENDIKLIKSSTAFTKFNLSGVIDGGYLKGGNYTFYLKYTDVDDNETDIIAQSGIVSVFKGEYSSSVGTLYNESSNKYINFNIENLDDSYNAFYLYYTREYSDTIGTLMYETKKINKKYYYINNTVDISIFGTEELTDFSEEDLNIQYYQISSAKAIAQQQDMLFIGNIKNNNINLQNISYNIKIEIDTNGKNLGWVEQFLYEDQSDLYEHYNVHNIYNYVGYWPGEYYRFGIVYILKDGSTTNVYNLIGLENNSLHNDNEYGIDNLNNFDDDGYCLLKLYDSII